MKIIFAVFSFVFLLLLISCGSNNNTTSAEDKERADILKHHIKTIKIYQTDYRNEIAQTEYLVQLKNYNKEGLKTEELNYNNSGKLISAINYNYDRNGNLVLTIAKNDSSGLIFRETRSYNNQNKREALIFYLPDGTYKYRNIATYDNDGNLIQLVWYWPDGLRATNNYKYQNGLKTEDVEFDAKGKFNYKWTYTYDKNGNQTNATQIYPDSAITAKISYSYNAENKLIKQVDYFGSSMRNQTFVTYNSSGLIDNIAEVSPGGDIDLRKKYQFEFYN